jgi:hypothetical protein
MGWNPASTFLPVTRISPFGSPICCEAFIYKIHELSKLGRVSIQHAEVLVQFNVQGQAIWTRRGDPVAEMRPKFAPAPAFPLG